MFMCNFWTVHFIAVIIPFFFRLTSSNYLWHFWAYISLYFFRTMSSGSSQHRARQRTEGGLAATRARVENKQAIPERSVVRADIMVAPLDIIYEII
jgi:hypothetical protein